MSKRWWDNPNYPRRVWGPEDWADWEAHGRPRTPRASPLSRLDQPPVPAPTHLLPAGFGLHAKASKARDARGKQVDRLLAALGVR
jgi:hypothetical protein